MLFDDLDRRMRVYETAHDLCILPGLWIVARLDGRGFTRLTRETRPFDAPFDERFHELMLATAEHLMTCGFNVRYGWTASDEISLLFDLTEDSYGRLERKILSVLAGEASALFSARLGAPACFDCRLSQLPSLALVVDYFRWRSEDAHRNAVNAHCYWLLRGQGVTPQAATERLSGMSIAAKNELLFQHGTNVNDLPGWQKRGTGLFWATVPKAGTNPLTGETVTTLRRQIQREGDLPLKDAYDAFLMRLLATPSAT